MNKMTIRDIDVADKRVLVRVDFNVPLDETSGAITDDNRIRAALPTIEYLVQRGAKVILMSHLGRPKGKTVDRLSLKNVSRRLSELLGQSVGMAPDCIGKEVEQLAANLPAGGVLLLENLRFHSEEEGGDASFAQVLARPGELYVDDAFGTAHRAHASITGVAAYLPAVAGLLMEKELDNLGGILERPAKPFGALLGGAKVSDKVALIENIMGKVNSIFIGGGMAANFLKAKGYEVGNSLLEGENHDLMIRLMAGIEQKGVKLFLPVDVVAADRIDPEAQTRTVSVGGISREERIADIGPKTIQSFSAELKKCQTIFWNGPMGVYEIDKFAEGTRAMARLLAGLAATTVIGGGSTAEMVADMGVSERMTFVSTGGGASLSFLGGEKLPGVEALRDK